MMKYVLMAVLLTGCTMTVEDEEPVDLTCRAECQDAAQCVLQCEGRGRAVSSDKRDVSP